MSALPEPARFSARSALLLLLVPVAAQAAGGHFSVDDASILDPGQWQVETWFSRFSNGDRLAEHVTPAARVGPVELSLDLARFAPQPTGSPWFWAPQVKWATPLSAQLSVGAEVSGTWQAGTSYPVGYTVLLPVTWTPADPLALHLNLGRDFLRNASDEAHGGVAIEWSPLSQGTFIAERFRENGQHAWRAGARWSPNASLSFDLSQARMLGDGSRRWWSLGINFVFGP